MNRDTQSATLSETEPLAELRDAAGNARRWLGALLASGADSPGPARDLTALATALRRMIDVHRALALLERDESEDDRDRGDEGDGIEKAEPVGARVDRLLDEFERSDEGMRAAEEEIAWV